MNYDPPPQKWTYLLYSSIFDSVGVVMIIDDFKVLHRLSLDGSIKLDIQFSFTCPLGENCEMSGRAHFHTYNTQASISPSVL